MSSEYGWTTEYVMTRTSREISWRIDSIIKRQNKDRVFEASINGINLNLDVSDETSDVQLTPEQEKAIAKSRQERLREIEQRHGR